MALTIISLIKQVPLPSEMRMGEDGNMDRTKAKSIINVDCAHGLEAALQMKKAHPDARMIVVTMGPPSFNPSLKKALAMGFDEAYLLSDRALGGSDTFATGLAIATLLKHLGFTKDSKEPFIVFAGRQTSDGDTAHVPSQVAGNLGIPQATFIERAEPYGDNEVKARRIIEGGYQELELPMPCLLSITPTGIEPRKPSLYGTVQARKTEIHELSAADIGLTTEHIGRNSPTIVSAVANIVSERPPVMLANGNTESELVDSFIKDFNTGGNVLVKAEKKVKAEKERPNWPDSDMRGDARGIMTWAEIVNGEVARPSLEILTPARHLADQLGNDTKITTLLIGKNVAGLEKTLFEHGADEVVLVEDDRLEEYRILPFTHIIYDIIKERNPEIALFAATTAGRELAPRVAVHTGSGVTADCTGLEIGEYVDRKTETIVKPILFSNRPTYGDSKLATILGFVCPQISTARAGAFSLPEPEVGKTGIVSTFTPKFDDEDFAAKIIKTVRGEGGLQSLFTADIIVSGGRGATSDNLQLIKDLTKALQDQGVNAEWACSRVVVDEGFAEYARQIGQTGKTVRPKVYVAVGISGAIQHIAGIKESGKIIAIDSNMKAQIFKNADFGIVGNYEDIVPELIEKVKGGFRFGL